MIRIPILYFLENASFPNLGSSSLGNSYDGYLVQMGSTSSHLQENLLEA